MAQVEIYTWQFCPFCIRAKSLLKKKGVDYKEYPIDGDAEGRLKMSQRADGRTTVPQIFINEKCIGGFDSLMQLEQSGELDQLIQK